MNYRLRFDNNVFSFYANPSRFMKLTNLIFPGAFLLMIGTLIAGVYFAFWGSPIDYQQKEAVRIMYVHVPASWMALGVYTFMALSGIATIVWRHTLAGILTQSAASIGVAFTLISLVTGSIWGKPMWGTWWVWDARLTSMLVLFFMYVAYISIAKSFDRPEQGERMGAYLCVIGWINIPLIKFSVEWWSTLHQPASIFKATGPSIHPDMMVPLLLMATSFGCFFVAMLILRARAILSQRRLMILKANESFDELKEAA